MSIVFTADNMENDKKDYQATISLKIKAGLKHV